MAMARKIGTWSLLAILVLAFTSAAYARVQRFGDIEANVPPGWTVEEAEGELIFFAPDYSASLVIVIAEESGTTAGAIAAEMSQMFNGSTPESSDGMYSFEFRTAEGVDGYVLVFLVEGTDIYMVWSVIGDHPDMITLLDSIQWVD